MFSNESIWQVLINFVLKFSNDDKNIQDGRLIIATFPLSEQKVTQRSINATIVSALPSGWYFFKNVDNDSQNPLPKYGGLVTTQ